MNSPAIKSPSPEFSALKALECGCGKPDCKWCGPILKLVKTVDDYIPDSSPSQG